MLETTTRLVSENLARAMNRRSFLKRAGETAFTGVAALMAGHLATSATSAAGKPAPRPQMIQCAPPGPYCNVNGTATDGCHGGSCYQHMVGGQVQQCRVYYQYYAAGCWTTASAGGYWTCCDCECGTPRVATCGCAQFSANPAPRPDDPRAGKG